MGCMISKSHIYPCCWNGSCPCSSCQVTALSTRTSWWPSTGPRSCCPDIRNTRAAASATFSWPATAVPEARSQSLARLCTVAGPSRSLYRLTSWSLSLNQITSTVSRSTAKRKRSAIRIRWNSMKYEVTRGQRVRLLLFSEISGIGKIVVRSKKQQNVKVRLGKIRRIQRRVQHYVQQLLF